MDIIKNKPLVGALAILVLLFGIYIFTNDNNKSAPSDTSSQEILNSLAQNPFYGVQDKEDLSNRIKQYLIKRLNEGATVDEVKEEIKSYIVGAKLAEDYVTNELTQEVLREVQQ